MTSAPMPELMTAEQLMALPDDGNQYELDAGRLIVMPPSSVLSSMVASRLGARAGIFIDQHDLGYYAGEGGGWRLARNPDTVRAPDFCFVRKERAGIIPPGYFPGTPDLVVEVLSPSDRANA